MFSIFGTYTVDVSHNDFNGAQLIRSCHLQISVVLIYIIIICHNYLPIKVPMHTVVLIEAAQGFVSIEFSSGIFQHFL